MRTTPKNLDDELTPEEILSDYPDLARIYGWKKETPGILSRAGVIVGQYYPTAKCYLFKRWSILCVIRLLNDNMQRGMMDVGDELLGL